MHHDGGYDTYAILPTAIRPRRIQPGRKTILVSILLSVMLLMSQMFRTLQLHQPPRLTNANIIQALGSMNYQIEDRTCQKTYLGSEVHTSVPEGSCHHLPPPRGLCSLTAQLFFTNKPQSCHHQKKVTFCQQTGDNITCNSPSECEGLLHYVGYFSDEEAEIIWKKVSNTKLTDAISNINTEDHFGFLFIRCTNDSTVADDLGQPNYDDAYLDKLESYNQLLLIPPKLNSVNELKLDIKDSVNVNFVMVDSLSRKHFYRSLPKTISVLEDLNQKLTPEAFDFEYVQAVKHRTYESLEALFSGYVNTTEIPFGTYDVPKKPLPIGDLFKKFKNKGYQTLWLEDLCWTWEWGIIKDLKVMTEGLHGIPRWKQLKDALTNAGIDRIDVSLASCEILKENGKNDPFHGIPAVCYNGRYHHEYMLEYLQLYQSTAQRAGQPFLTFTSTSVSHEETGVRVQSIDNHLSSYIKFASKLKNTVTVLFSDHGNTYGKFIQSSSEAHIETYNPSLFVVIPKDVQGKNHLGDVHMRILQENQKHLVSLIDVHNFVLSLIKEESDIVNDDFNKKYVIPGGFLSNIPGKRTCSDIPLLQPNLCICRNYELPVEPSHLHMSLADFAINVLNNELLRQHRRGAGLGFGNCRPLKPLKIRKAHEVRVAAGLTQYKLDVVVQGLTDSKLEEDNEIFFVTVEAGLGSTELRLVSYERLTVYGIYNQCKDSGVEVKLCICKNKPKTLGKKGILNSLIFGSLFGGFSFLSKDSSKASDPSMIQYLTSPIFDINPQIDETFPSSDPCLFTIIHKYKYGFLLLGANLCSSIHKIEVTITSRNLYLSTVKNPSFVLHSYDVKLLVAGVVANYKADWEWNHHLVFN